MNHVTLPFCLGNMMCHTFLLRERESGGELARYLWVGPNLTDRPRLSKSLTYCSPEIATKPPWSRKSCQWLPAGDTCTVCMRTPTLRISGEHIIDVYLPLRCSGCQGSGQDSLLCAPVYAKGVFSFLMIWKSEDNGLTSGKWSWPVVWPYLHSLCWLCRST